jgi:hypothetical protein
MREVPGWSGVFSRPNQNRYDNDSNAAQAETEDFKIAWVRQRPI